MAFPIKFLLLQKSELLYEVTIRGEAPADNVLELRRQITRLTQKFPSEDIYESCLDFLEDYNGFAETLEKVKNNINALMSDMQKSLVDRTQTLLNHLHFRLQRIVSPKSSDQLKSLNNLKKSFESLFSQFADIIKSSVPTVEGTSSSKVDTLGEGLTKIAVTCDRGISSDLSKLKYDGKTCVRAFIQRLSEFRIAKDISDTKILNAATEIFTGDALHWFRSVRSRVHTWDELLILLKNDFDVADYDYRMLSEIRSRSQGNTENITVYLAIMEGMFSRLGTPMSENDKLDILLHNIRPCYANILATCSNINSVNDLRTLCRNFERVKVRCDNFREPPNVNFNSLAPEFAYQNPKDVKNYPKSSYFANTKPNDNYKKTYALSQNNKKYCHRCRVDTHTMKECNAERTIFCFKCGMKDVRIPECPNCNPKQLEESKN